VPVYDYLLLPQNMDGTGSNVVELWSHRPTTGAARPVLSVSVRDDSGLITTHRSKRSVSM
jgi:hypothetical protein